MCSAVQIAVKIYVFLSGDPTYAPAIIAPATIAPLKATIAPR